jgi:hypothetical protein
MSIPVGTINDDAVVLAKRIRRRVTSSKDNVVLAWCEFGDIYASDIDRPAAQRIQNSKPSLIIGIYTSAAKGSYIEADIEAIKQEFNQCQS